MPVAVCLSLLSAQALQTVAEQLALALFPGSVLCLSGDLGAGKTTFVKGLGRGLGCPTEPTSPTFSLIDEHLGGRLPLYHVDLYRLTPEQVPALHLEAYLSPQEFPPGVLAVEWPERLPRPFAECLYLRFALHAADAERRDLTIEARGDRHGALLRSLDWSAP
ncbi:MAG: tRNA (adenosine(37)-N6)-threonylcarbamoyltransferase complex ATPase subunit type 1 TsaE [Pseudanabaenaceae cyanobacterium]